jgi:hypothetical protein
VRLVVEVDPVDVGVLSHDHSLAFGASAVRSWIGPGGVGRIIGRRRGNFARDPAETAA